MFSWISSPGSNLFFWTLTRESSFHGWRKSSSILKCKKWSRTFVFRQLTFNWLHYYDWKCISYTCCKKINLLFLHTYKNCRANTEWELILKVVLILYNLVFGGRYHGSTFSFYSSTTTRSTIKYRWLEYLLIKQHFLSKKVRTAANKTLLRKVMLCPVGKLRRVH